LNIKFFSEQAAWQIAKKIVVDVRRLKIFHDLTKDRTGYLCKFAIWIWTNSNIF